MIWEVFWGIAIVVLLSGFSLAAAMLLPAREETRPKDEELASQASDSSQLSSQKGQQIGKKIDADVKEKDEQKRRSVARKGRQALKKGDFLNAEKYLYQAAGYKGEDAKALKDLAQALYSQGKLDKARITQEKLVQLEPNEENLIFLGRILRQLGQVNDQREYIENSIFCFQSILKKDSLHLEANTELALTYISLGMEQEAANSYEEILDTYPSQKEAGIFLVDYYRKTAQLENLNAVLAKMEKYYPQDAGVLLQRMMFLYDQKDYANAGEICESLLELGERSDKIVKKAGLCAYFLNDYKKAVDYFEDLLDSSTDDPGFYYNIALSYMALQRYDEAAEYIQKAIDSDAEQARFHFLLAKISIRKREKAQAKISLRRVLELEPEHFEAMQELKRLG